MGGVVGKTFIDFQKCSNLLMTVNFIKAYLPCQTQLSLHFVFY